VSPFPCHYMMLDIWQGVSLPQAFIMGTGSQTVRRVGNTPAMVHSFAY